MARELNDLPAASSGSPAPSCPAAPVGGSRSELIVISYHDAHDATILIGGAPCTPVTNGRTVRDGLWLPGRPERHWPGEGLL